MKPKVCLKCKKECSCTCLQYDMDEYGVHYFCSEKCAKDYEKEFNVDVDDICHLPECEQKGFYKKEWVDNLQKQFIIWREMAEDRHRKWITLKNKLKDLVDGKTGGNFTPNGVVELTLKNIKTLKP